MAAADRPLLIGVDAGSSRIRALVFDPEGRAVAEGSRPTETFSTRPEWAHYEPDAIWAAAVGALADATAQIDDPRRIVSLAVASIGESAVPIDRDGRPTYQAIAWFDKRTRPQAERLDRTIGADRLFAVTGMALDPIYGLFKILWLKDNEPEAFGRTERWLNIADYLAWRLCGVQATEAGLACRCMALDLRRGAWADDLLAEVGVPAGLFPELRPSGAALAPVSADVATATGLPPHCLVAVGGHDHFCGALAVGALKQGVLLDSMGTAEAVMLTVDQPIDDPACGRRGYAQSLLDTGERHYFVLGALFTSGGAIEWFRDAMAGGADHATLIAEAEGVPPGSLGAQFLPHLRLGTPPVPDANARGAFLGLSTDIGRGALYRAVLEGIANDTRRLADGIGALGDVPDIGEIRAIGGNTHNDLLMRIKAAVYDRPITVVDQAEAVSLGVALLGGVAAGVFPDAGSAVAATRGGERVVMPEPALVPGYQRRYRSLYGIAADAVAPVHHRIHAPDDASPA